MQAPRFSLIVVTMAGRDHLLQECLASIDRQRFRDFEVIVADQAGNPRIRGMVERHAWGRYLAVPRDGLSANRNRGLAVARGELLAFPDDDATLAEDMLQRAEQLFRASPELGLLSGTAIDPRTGRRIFRFPAEPAVLTVWNAMRRHFSSTLIVSRGALAGQSEAFDPALGVGTSTPFGGSEETDLVLRLLLAGVPARYEPTVVVYHPNTELVAIPRPKAVSYGIGLGACFRKSRRLFGWWPIGAVWAWTLVRACGGVVVDTLRGRPGFVRQRVASIRARLYGWWLYDEWAGPIGPAPELAEREG